MVEMLPVPRLLADGFAMVESARWHEDRLWLAHWGAGEVVAVDLAGRTEVVALGRESMGWSIAWLPGGELLVSGGEELSRIGPDGSLRQPSSSGRSCSTSAPVPPCGPMRSSRNGASCGRRTLRARWLF